MSEKTKVEIHGGFSFGFWAFIGALCAFGWMVIGAWMIDWVEDKISSHKTHKTHYVITANPNQSGQQIYLAEDYSRKISGQIVFTDCETGAWVNLPPTIKIEVTDIPSASSTACEPKVKPPN